MPKIKKLLQKSSTGFSQFEAEEFKDRDEEETDIDVVVRENNDEAVPQSGDPETQAEIEEEKPVKQIEEMAEKNVPDEESDEEEAQERSMPRHVSAKAAREALFQPGNRKESEDQPKEPAND